MKVGAILIPPVFRYMKKQVNVSPAVFEDRTVLSVWQLDKVFFFPPVMWHGIVSFDILGKKMHCKSLHRMLIYPTCVPVQHTDKAMLYKLSL